MDWIVYILELSDGSLYTGITNNLQRRIVAHNNGRGSAYVYSRRPIKKTHIIYQVSSRSEALKIEAKIKSMSRAEKEKLIKEQENE